MLAGERERQEERQEWNGDKTVCSVQCAVCKTWCTSSANLRFLPLRLSHHVLFHVLFRSSFSRYTEKDAIVLVRKMLKALGYCHSKNICHRDLKLENFLFESEAEDAEVGEGREGREGREGANGEREKTVRERRERGERRSKGKERRKEAEEEEESTGGWGSDWYG